MNWRLRFYAIGTGLVGPVLSFAAILGLAMLIGYATNSGFGSCGPYGPASSVVIIMILGSVPASILIGLLAAQWAQRRFLANAK